MISNKFSCFDFLLWTIELRWCPEGLYILKAWKFLTFTDWELQHYKGFGKEIPHFPISPTLFRKLICVVAKYEKLNKIFGLFSNILTYFIHSTSVIAQPFECLFWSWNHQVVLDTDLSYIEHQWPLQWWASAINWGLIPADPTTVHMKAVVISAQLCTILSELSICWYINPEIHKLFCSFSLWLKSPALLWYTLCF